MLSSRKELNVLMTSMYLRKNSFMGQALQTEDKLKKSVKKTLNAFFSKHIFFKTACKITFRLFNRLT